jgi:large subunit ribosomal protein L3
MTMVEGLIGKKIGMSQQFDDAGNVVPVTVIQAGPCTVIQKKTAEKDGYAAVQLGFVEARAVRKPGKPQVGHFKKAGVPVVKKLQEVGCSDPAAVKEGDQVLVDIFEIGEIVHVVGTSKGKGFAGVVKRHHFAGGGAAHGSMFHRAPGSIGASSYPSRVVKGSAGGHMGMTGHIRGLGRGHGQGQEPRRQGRVPDARGGYALITKARSRDAAK